MGNICKGKASHRPRAREEAAQTKWTGWDTIQRAAERVAHEDSVRRGGLEASEACRNRALRERDISRAHATDAEFEEP